MLWSAIYLKFESWSSRLERAESWQRYAIAYLLFLFAFLARLLVLPLNGGYPFLTFFPAAILAFFLCGMRPGLVCAILSGVCGYFFFEPPVLTWTPTYQSVLSGSGYIFSVWLVGSIIAASREHARSAVQLQKELGERTLKVANQNLQLAMEAAQLGLWQLDLGTDTIHASERALDSLGIPTAEPTLHYARFRQAFHPDDRELLDKQIAECRSNLSDLEIELRVVWPDASLHWVSVFGRTFLAGDKTSQHLQGMLRDITQRKELNQQLSESKHLLEQLAESMPQIVWASDRQGRNVYSNGQWAKYTGLPASETIDQGWLSSLHPDDLALPYQQWEHSNRERIPYSFECRIRSHEGVYRWFLVRGVPVLDTQGAIDRWYGTCTDIHDLKLAQEELAASRTRALEEVQTLRGLVNICAWCRKTLDEDGRWITIEDYVQRHSQAVFSHGICSTCKEEAMAERVLGRKSQA